LSLVVTPVVYYLLTRGHDVSQRVA
jgi:hypothetical protein